MTFDTPQSTLRLFGRPVHAMLAPIPAACFTITFVTDLAYWKTTAIMWADMSAWLLSVGLVASALVILAGMIDFFGDRRIRALPGAWVHGLGNGVAVLLSIVNVFVHSRDAYTSVVPTGLILSGLVTLILLVTAWIGWGMVHRHGVGVRLEDRA